MKWQMRKLNNALDIIFSVNVFTGIFSDSLREQSLKFMEFFGSQLFGNIKFRDSFVMIGQRGVAKGKAIEFVIVFVTILVGYKFNVTSSPS